MSDLKKPTTVNIDYKLLGDIDLGESPTADDALKKYLLRFINTIKPRLGMCAKIKYSETCYFYLGVLNMTYDQCDYAPVGAERFHFIFQLGDRCHRRFSTGLNEINVKCYLRVSGFVKILDNGEAEYLEVDDLAYARDMCMDESEYNWHRGFYGKNGDIEGGISGPLFYLLKMANEWWTEEDIAQTYD